MTAESERQIPGDPPLRAIAPLEDAASLHAAASQVLEGLLEGTGDGWLDQAVLALEAHDRAYQIFVRVHRACVARGLPGAADVLETALEVHDALCASLVRQVQTGDCEAARASLAGHRDWSALMASQADLWSPAQADGPGRDRAAPPPPGPLNSGNAAPAPDEPLFAASARPLPPALPAAPPLVAPSAREAPHGPPYVPAPRARPVGRTLANTRVASLPGTALRNAWLIPAVLFVVLLFGALLAGLVMLPPDGLNGFLDPIVVN